MVEMYLRGRSKIKHIVVLDNGMFRPICGLNVKYPKWASDTVTMKRMKLCQRCEDKATSKGE
jgi:hypothetical protein